MGTNVTVDVGSSTQIVVGATKFFSFAGVGLEDGDQFKYVPGSIVTDAGCGQGTANAHDGFVGVYSSFSGTSVSFSTASTNGALKLCYKFGSGVYKLYDDFPLSVATV